MAIYKYLRQAWQSGDSQLWKERMIQFRKEPVTLRVDKPLRLDRARSVGYKAKQGFIVVRQKVKRGGRMRPKIVMGRRPKHYRHKMIHKRDYRAVAEERASKKFPNCTVLGSYFLCKDSHSAWYEIILVDGSHPNIKGSLAKMAAKKGRVQRGLTNAGRRGRGLKGKGKGFEKARPSLNANKGRQN